MRYPFIDNIQQSRDITTYFNGYNHKLSCPEGSFYDMKNVTTDYYPILSPRMPRAKGREFTKFQGIIGMEELLYVDNGVLYVNGVAKVSNLSTTTEKTITKMGAYIVIFPDKVWYNTKDGTSGNMGAKVTKNQSVSFTLCGADGTAITYHDDAYYASHSPANGDYKMSTVNGKTSLSVYSSATKIWTSVATTYMKIASTGIGSAFDKEDGVKITIDFSGISWDYGKNFIFVSEDASNTNLHSSTFVIADKGNDYITVTALLNENKTFTVPITVEREVPDIAYVTECQNRLWGCSKDGHEIYCCKLGDVKNWNVFAGISTDSWAATIGTDGKFTGAATYLGYPIFFKEDSLVRVTVSSTGGHSTKDIYCRGVQSGSAKSICIVDELLYYKSDDGVCVYDGNFPTSISDVLGKVRYTDAVGGSLESRYYISMKDENEDRHIFVYDAKNKLWAKEDKTNVKAFCKYKGKLYFVSDNFLWDVNGVSSETKEKTIDWMVESGNIGYATADKKYISRFNVRMFLANESHVSMYIQYDDGAWEFLWNMNGYGIKTFSIPVVPKRCDHFRIRLSGKGEAKLYTISKTMEEGSDI